MDFPAAGQALWGISDSTGIRPEWLLPVLAYESGLQTNIQNSQGYPYYGLNQISGDYLAGISVAPADYLTWSASQQLSNVVGPYMAAEVAKYGPLRSGIRVYQANFYPASLAYARGLDDVIVATPAAAYTANSGFDTAGKGYISPRDLGAAVAKMAAKSSVRSAIAQTYAIRPWELQTDPVYGFDFLSPLQTVLVVASAAFLTSVALSYFRPQVLPSWARIPAVERLR